MTMNTTNVPETRRRAVSSPERASKEVDAASGFILKLFQMVNGAPDEVISWTPSGDAFVIGSDLKRLESETLPQYFRHNRFQSLVRQLNFYSFRKINRERNVWIYKHALFHRDQPENLYMVRRRTCPGTDGRKQRFSRVSARQLGQPGVDSSSDEESLVDAADVLKPVREKNIVVSPEPPQKLVRLLSGSSSFSSAVANAKIDTRDSASPVASRDISESDEPDEESRLLVTRKKRSDFSQQSMVVSQVALKLDEFARKAGHQLPRARRGGSGVVTPPYGSSLYPSSRSLLTYDDEFGNCGMDSRSNLGAVSFDGSESNQVGSGFDPHSITQSKGNLKDVPPVVDYKKIEGIAHRILQDCPVYITAATVAGFCMSTSPVGGDELCSKILQLIVSCPTLMSDFRQYRAALRPRGESGSTLRAETVQQIWEGEASRGVAVRDFKVYVVNYLQQILGNGGEAPACQLLTIDEKALLEHTAGIWLKSTGSV